jgi:hypothetical protein
VILLIDVILGAAATAGSASWAYAVIASSMQHAARIDTFIVLPLTFVEIS